jgi:hypothetical protein
MDELNDVTSLLDIQEISDYRYKPMQHPDSIRLICLVPGEMESPIQIYLAEFRLQENPPYEALSYTWATEDGDCSLSSQIRCSDARLLVTKNCELALRYLRETDSRRILWVDSICINQRDFKERSHQVGIMRDVYATAPQVLIWLGEASKDLGVRPSHQPDSVSSSALEIAPDPQSRHGSSNGEAQHHEEQQNNSSATMSVSEIFFDFLEKLYVEMGQLTEAGQSPTLSPLYQELIFQVHAAWGRPPETYPELCRGFVDIVNRRWWTRVWVVQEVVAAKSAIMICSNKSTNYTNFLNWYRLVVHDKSPEASRAWNTFGPAYKHLNAVRIAFRAENACDEALAFLDAAHGARELNASDPRDHVYGVLGLSIKFKNLLPSPDYKKTTTEVFTDLAKAFIKRTKSLAVLEHATSTTTISNHPSWVPFWPSTQVIWYQITTQYNASKQSETIFSFSPDGQELWVKGKEFDRVKELPLANLEAYAYSSGFDQRIEGYRMSCKVGFSLTKYPTGESVEETLWRSLSWNVDSKLQYPAPEGSIHSFREWYRLLTSVNTIEYIEKEITGRGSFQWSVSDSSPLCTTASGYLAGVPYTTKVGDCIALLGGGKFPFILRPNGDHYCLVGPCYVHGIMNGEAFPENPDELQWFHIR